jgi:hypothetical protein
VPRSFDKRLDGGWGICDVSIIFPSTSDLVGLTCLRWYVQSANGLAHRHFNVRVQSQHFELSDLMDDPELSRHATPAEFGSPLSRILVTKDTKISLTRGDNRFYVSSFSLSSTQVI